MVKTNQKRASLQRKHITGLLMVFALVLAVNILGSLKFFRLDLSAEHRFSLGKGSREILRDLDDIVYIKVYLDGDLPAEFLRFRQDIKEKLDDFKAYGGSNLEYEFVNLYEIEEVAERNRVMKELANKGLKLTDVKIKDKEGGLSTKIIFPGAIISYKGIEFPVNLLKNNPGLAYQVNLSNSVQTLEYEFIQAIHSLTRESIEKIAFIRGQNELDFLQTYDLGKELSLFFDVKWERIDGNLPNLMEYKAIIIAQPLKPFSERDKFVLDQYIMHGGKALFFLDPVQANADSLSSGLTYTTFLDLNLYDLLFKYGFKIDYNLIKDAQANYVRVQTSVNDQQPTMNLLPWVYYPLISALPDNPLTKGLNYIKAEYVSALDTTNIAPEGVSRSVILSSSDTSALIQNPSFIFMDEITRPPDFGQYNKSRLPIAILAQGQFPSFYANYGVPASVRMGTYEKRNKSLETMVFLAGDGDLVRNEVNISGRDTVPLPLGYDKDTRQTYGNKDFVMNVINFMTDDADLIELRGREHKLRLLDHGRLRFSSVRLWWQVFNVLVPVILVIVFGIIYSVVRKRKFGRQ